MNGGDKSHYGAYSKGLRTDGAEHDERATACGMHSIEWYKACIVYSSPGLMIILAVHLTFNSSSSDLHHRSCRLRHSFAHFGSFILSTLVVNQNKIDSLVSTTSKVS